MTTRYWEDRCPKCLSTNVTHKKTDGPLMVWSGDNQIEYYLLCEDCSYGWCNIFKYAGFVEEYDDDETLIVGAEQ